MFAIVLLLSTGSCETTSGLWDPAKRVIIKAAESRDGRDYDTTFVWGTTGQGCYEVCVDHDLTCDPRAFRAVKSKISNLQDTIASMMTDEVFDGEFTDLGFMSKGVNFCRLDDREKIGNTKSTAAPYRRIQDGKCFVTGQTNNYKPMRGRYKCHPWFDTMQRFCGCKPSAHQEPVPMHIFNIANPDVDGSEGWRPVTNTTCGRACREKGLECNAEKHQEIRGVKDMMTLDGMMEERGWAAALPWYTPCRTYDARFFRALNPQHKYGTSKCWANPADRAATPPAGKEAVCWGIRKDKEIMKKIDHDYNAGFRYCYCD